jgi:hypothetical protein
VNTYCIGMAASMATVLLAAGTKGKRHALPNCRVMIHQPSGGATGQTSDISIAAKEILRWRDTLNHVLAKHSGRTAAELQKKDKRWKVSFIGGPKDAEVVEAEVYVGDEEGNIAEVRTGPQVAWMMARGYEGAFGRAVNRWRIWIPLCVVFLLVLLPITRPRTLLSWRTLDLLVLLSFTASWAWFNEGDISTSVPLQYPPLIYLLARMVWITVTRARRRRAPATPGEGEEAAARRPGLPGWMPTWLLMAKSREPGGPRLFSEMEE